VGLVLGAGGQVGQAFHAGVLSALAEVTGWDPRRAAVIVGTSAGSIAGAMLRAGFPAADLAARSMRRPMSAEGAAIAARVGLRPPSTPRRARPAPRRIASTERLARAWRAPWAVRPGSIAAAVMPEGQVPMEPLLAPFRSLFPAGWPAAPLWPVAVDLDRGNRVVFGRAGSPPAPVAEAVAASCAIPAYFSPVAIDGRRYVDGGVHSTTNADVLVEPASGAPPDLVVIVVPMSMTRGARNAGIESPVRRIVALRLGREVAALRGRGIDVVAFQPATPELEVMTGNALDSGKMPAVCERAREAVFRRLSQGAERDRLAVLG
jgi:NTE family protein